VRKHTDQQQPFLHYHCL